MIKTIDQINEAVKIVLEIYKSAGRERPIEYLEKSARKTIVTWRGELKPYRDRIAAHRYITKHGKFLRVGDIMRLYGKVSNEELSKIKTELFDCYNKIKSWLNNPVNRNHLILAREK